MNIYFNVVKIIILFLLIALTHVVEAVESSKGLNILFYIITIPTFFGK